MLGAVSARDEKHGRKGSSEHTLVYAGLAGLAGVVPIPIVDGMVSALARGAAMRRVAMRHGVALSRSARKVLAAPGVREASGSTGARVVRSLVTRFVPPVRMAARAEDAVATVIAAVLLDHYLATADRTPGPIGELEARVLRAAMDAAIGPGAFASMRDAPAGVGRAMKDAVDSTRGDDDEGRGLVERVADVLLDGIADVPAGLALRLRTAFDDALAAGSTLQDAPR